MAMKNSRTSVVLAALASAPQPHRPHVIDTVIVWVVLLACAIGLLNVLGMFG